MVRTREFEPGDALNRAMEVFASRGYKNTSMEDVVNATGVSRYGLYGTFGSKRELFEQSLDKYGEQMGKAAFIRMSEADATLDSIRTVFDEHLVNATAKGRQCGCLLTLTAMEMAPTDPEIKEVVRNFMSRMAKAFELGLGFARDKGEVKTDVNVHESAQYLLGAYFGLSVMANAGFDRPTLETYIDSVIATIAA